VTAKLQPSLRLASDNNDNVLDNPTSAHSLLILFSPFVPDLHILSGQLKTFHINLKSSADILSVWFHIPPFLSG